VCAVCVCRLLGAARREGDKEQIASWLRTQLRAALQQSASAAYPPILIQVVTEIDSIDMEELLDCDDVAELAQTAMLCG
jgi:hypothetical protein